MQHTHGHTQGEMEDEDDDDDEPDASKPKRELTQTEQKKLVKEKLAQRQFELTMVLYTGGGGRRGFIPIRCTHAHTHTHGETGSALI